MVSKNIHADEDWKELVGRTDGLQPWRRVLHVVGGSSLAWLVYALTPSSASTRWGFGVSCVVVFSADLLRLRWEPLNRFLFGPLSAFACPRDVARITGLTWFFLGVFSVLWIAGGAYAVPSVLVLALADPVAGILGRLFGKRRIGKGTLEGSVAFFVTAVVVLIPFAGVPVAILVAGITAALEVLLTRSNDNLIIPIATAVCLWLFL